MEVIFDANDNLIRVNGLRDATAAAGVFLNAGVTMTAELLDEDDVSIVSGLTFAYTASSDGDYVATIPDTTSFTKNTRGIIEITCNAGVGLQAFWTLPFRIRTRDE